MFFFLIFHCVLNYNESRRYFLVLLNVLLLLVDSVTVCPVGGPGLWDHPKKSKMLKGCFYFLINRRLFCFLNQNGFKFILFILIFYIYFFSSTDKLPF